MTTATTVIKKIECRHCAGKGIVHSTERYRRRYVDIWLDCSRCNGRGYFELEWCEACANECVLPTGELCECALLPEEPESNETPATVTYNGGTVTAPGFTDDTFAQGVAKAIDRGYLRMQPVGAGAVLIESASSDARYTVTREHCECIGHLYAGHCYHRAAAIACNDLWGIDLRYEEVLGFDQDGRPVTRAERKSRIAEAA